MIKATDLSDLKEKVLANTNLNEMEKERLLKQASSSFQSGDIIYVFFTVDEIESTNFRSEIKDGLREILLRKGEVGAVYHEPDLRQAWRLVKLHC